MNPLDLLAKSSMHSVMARDVGSNRDKHRLERLLNQLSRCNIHELRLRWRRIFAGKPPMAFGPDLLRRSIAYRLQERMYGGISASTRRDLLLAIRSATSKRSGKLSLPRQIKPGSVLIREWKGSAHRVTVLDDGRFLYAQQKYQNLSEIARKITGTRWNGPRFFGLRKPTDHLAKSESKRSRE
jgi:hypothetical protein